MPGAWPARCSSSAATPPPTITMPAARQVDRLLPPITWNSAVERAPSSSAAAGRTAAGGSVHAPRCCHCQVTCAGSGARAALNRATWLAGRSSTWLPSMATVMRVRPAINAVTPARG
jgi:hypothetical protein